MNRNRRCLDKLPERPKRSVGFPGIEALEAFPERQVLGDVEHDLLRVAEICDLFASAVTEECHSSMDVLVVDRETMGLPAMRPVDSVYRATVGKRGEELFGGDAIANTLRLVHPRDEISFDRGHLRDFKTLTDLPFEQLA